MTIAEWSEFFVAAAGASAALAGLIIVAMSVSVDQMIAIPSMTSRAAAAIAVLIVATVGSLAGLMPGQGLVALGVEVLVLGLGALGFTVYSAVRVMRARGGATLAQALLKSLLGVLPAAAFTVAAVLLMLGSAGGLRWLAAGIVFAIVVSVVNAWVVLVEIRR